MDGCWEYVDTEQEGRLAVEDNVKIWASWALHLQQKVTDYTTETRSMQIIWGEGSQCHVYRVQVNNVITYPSTDMHVIPKFISLSYYTKAFNTDFHRD